MKQSSGLSGFILKGFLPLMASFLLSGVGVFSVCAETVEITTFYPTQTNTAALNVGVLTADQIGIGTDTVNADAVLQVVGQDDAISEVLFLPGTDNDSGDSVRTAIRMGIDWPSPLSTLHIHNGTLTGSTIDEMQLTLHNNTSGTFHRRAGLLLRTADATNTPIYAGIYTQKDTANSHKLHFDVGTNAGIPANAGNTDGTTATAMTITNQGFVGIGTVNPVANLHVVGSSRFEEAPFFVGGNGDVNGDGFISPIDVLLPVNALNSGTSLPPDQHVRADVNGDGLVTGLDVNLIVDHINTNGSGGPPLTIPQREALKGRGSLALSVDINNNLGVNVREPLLNIPAVPNGNVTGNINANDVFIRSANRWASQGSGVIQGIAGFEVRFLNIDINTNHWVIVDLRTNPPTAAAFGATGATNASVQLVNTSSEGPFAANTRLIPSIGYTFARTGQRWNNVAGMARVTWRTSGTLGGQTIQPGQIGLECNGDSWQESRNPARGRIDVNVVVFQY